jgi:hypothetical protein
MNQLERTFKKSNLSIKTMQKIRLFSLGIMLIFLTPLSSFAEMKMSSSTNMSGQNRVSNGTDITTSKTNRIMEMDAQMNNQIRTFEVSDDGIKGPVNELAIQNIEQTYNGDPSSKQSLNRGMIENDDTVSTANGEIISEDTFSVTATINILQENLEMYEQIVEQVITERKDAFSATSNSSSFSTGAGFSSNF